VRARPLKEGMSEGHTILGNVCVSGENSGAGDEAAMAPPLGGKDINRVLAHRGGLN